MSISTPEPFPTSCLGIILKSNTKSVKNTVAAIKHQIMDWGCRLCSSQPRPKVMGQTWKWEGGNDLDFNKTNRKKVRVQFI